MYCHRNCVSTYTSKNHIDRHLNQKRKSTVPEEKTSKRTRSSSDKSFLFKQDCLFCGKECLERDKKNPGRWRIYYIVRTVNRPNKTAFKDFILKVCDLRRDSWAEEVEFRVKSAISDLHASDARYHEDCRKSFCRSVYLDTLRASSSKEEDQALKHVIQLMKDNQESSWNSVEIENLYREYGGYELNRANLVKTLSIHFGDDLLVLSAPGVASILLFKAKCHLSILSEENDADKSVKDLARTISNETVKQNGSVYQVRLDSNVFMEGVSSTLKNFLVELRIPKLPSALIGSIISSYIMKQRTHLQVVMSNLVKRKFLIEELRHYGITSAYDEYLQFKGSAAFAVRQKEAS